MDTNKLREAAKLIRKGWTQNAIARDEYGTIVYPNDDGAVCWCLRGAVIRASSDDSEELYYMKGFILNNCGMKDFEWNDRPCQNSDNVAKMLIRMADHYDEAIAEINATFK